MAFEEEGLTSFVVDENDRPFRFRVSVVDTKFQLWLQDSETKQEWHMPYVDMSDCHDGNPPLRRAQLIECAEDVVAGLDANSGYERAFGNANEIGERVLSLGMLVSRGSTMKARFEYAFTLLPVATNSFDAVTACVRGLEEENTRLKEDIAAMKDELKGLKQENEQRDAFITAEASGEVDPGAAMKWNACGDYKARDFQFQDGGHTVELVRGGRYVIGLLIASNGRYVVQYEVRVNGKEEQTLCDSRSGHTLSFVVHVPAKALLRVVNVSTHQGKTNARLTIAAI